jgi:16S rRNA (cytosine1402-N4)-methyltransferase
VLLEETLAFLRNGPGFYLDATLGDGGHAEALLERESGARLLACDRDPAALEFAGERLGRFGDRVMFARASFRELREVHRARGGEHFTGALFDLGLSSRQIDDARRGMSFMMDGPLDLRMDPDRGEPASARLARVEDEELTEVLRVHGDVRGAARIARVIVAEARAARLDSTRALVAAVTRAIGGRPHPRLLAQVFQAIRIWTNEEAADLSAVLEWLPEAMGPGGVVVTLAYHSGEDRMIKRALRATRGEPASRRRPPAMDARLPEGPWTELTPRVVTPSDGEKLRNPRSRSARLRAFRRIEK